MSEAKDNVVKAILHYQRNLDKYQAKNEDGKMLHCIERLNSLPVTVAHLQDTGVGRTVNALRKSGGSVGDAARSLVNKWKGMVEEDESEHEEEETDEKAETNSYSSHKEKNKDKSREKERSEKHKQNSRKSETRKSTSPTPSSSENKRKHENGERESSKKAKVKDEEASKSDKKKEKHHSNSKHKHDHHHKKSHSDNEHKPHKHKEAKKSKHKDKAKSTSVHADDLQDGIDGESGTSFAEALGMLQPTTSKAQPKKSITTSSSTPIEKFATPKKLEPLSSPVSYRKFDNSDFNCFLPTISNNYKPLPMNYLLDNQKLKKEAEFDDESLTRLMYAKVQRTKVYSGNKCFWGKIPSLFELCIRVLQDNIDALEYTGGVPFTILKPILDKASPDQLYMLEHHNPYLIDDSDDLWQFHCQKMFRNKKRDEMETWRDMYMRCLDEREAKLKALTANIKLSQDKSLPVRQTKLAYVDSVVKPPRNIAKKQAKNQIASNNRPLVTPRERLSTIASAGCANLESVPNPVRTSVGSSSTLKQKKAPLMAKTLQLMKGRFRR